MRNIISLQLEQLSCSISLMVYSKCLVNIKMKRPARNTDPCAVSVTPEASRRAQVMTEKIALGKMTVFGASDTVLPQLSKC